MRTINRMSNVQKTIVLGFWVALLTGCAGMQPRIAQTTSGHPEVTLNTDNLELVKEVIVLEMQIRGAVLQSDSNDQLAFSKQITGTNAMPTQPAIGIQSSTTPDAKIFFTISKAGRTIQVVASGQTGDEDMSGNNAWFNNLHEILYAVEYDVEKASTTGLAEAKPVEKASTTSSAEVRPDKSVLESQRTITYADGSKYIGGVRDGKPDGTGTFTWASGARYLGDWSAGKRTGTGTYFWADGDKYVGQWLADRRSGIGTMLYVNGVVKAGVWRDGVYIGPATNAEPAVASEQKPTQ
jgi:hypothetical protein